MFSLICGVISTIIGVVMFPLAIGFSRTPNAAAFIGFLGFITMFSGIAGTIASIVKLSSTDENNPDDKNDRALARKGLWFSVIPSGVWIILIAIGMSR